MGGETRFVPAIKYADGEMEYIPKHFDEQTRKLVRYMIQEAFQAGHTQGFESGNRLGSDISVGMLYDVIEKLQK